MTTHAKLSPSKSPRWRRCAGSVREEAKYPEERSGAAAVDGTHSHTLFEKCIKELMSPYAFVGQTLKDDDGEFVVDKDRAERVEFAVNFIMQRRIEIDLASQIISEKRVDPAPLIGIAGLDGTIDVRIIGKNTIEVWDYKDGMSPVDADSYQLEQYGFGAIAEIPTSQREQYKTITLGIIQPKLRTKGMSGIVFKTIPMDEFMTRAQKLYDDAVATQDPNAPLVPGDEQCKYCRAKGGCSALTNAALEASGITFANLDVATQAANQNANELSDEKIREILEAAPLIRQMLDGVEAEALRRFEAGQSIAGLKLVRGRGSRAWMFPEEEMAEKLKKMGLPKDAIWETKLISPAKAEKVTWTKRDGTQKQLTDKQLKLIAAEYVKKSDGKLTVVSSSDDRPAVELNAASMFGAVETLPSWLS